jgi:hypothetical protein
MLVEMQWFTEWQEKRRFKKAAREAAWQDANDTGADGLSNFERRVLAALEPVVGPLSLIRAGAKMPYLWGSVPNTNLVLYIYGDEAQVHGDRQIFRKERWDYDSPDAYIRDLVAFIRNRLPSPIPR